MDPFPDAAAVDFELCLSRPTGADAAGKTGHGGMLGGEARQEVFQLGQLHLDLALPAVSPLREDVENHLGPVDDFHFGEICQGTDLSRGQLVIEDEEVRPHLEGLDDHVRQLAPAQDVAGVPDVAILDHGVEDLDAAGTGQFLQLRQGEGGVGHGIGFNPDQDPPIGGLDLPGLLAPDEFPFQGGDECGEVDPDLGGTTGFQAGPELALVVFRDEMGAVDDAGETVGEGLHGGDHVEAQEGQVREIVVGKLLAVEMGMDQAQSLEAHRGGAEAVEIGDDDPLVIAHDDIGDLAAAGDQ